MQIGMFSVSTVAILLELATLLSIGLMQLSLRSDESAMIADHSLAASQFNTRIAQSRYHASGYALTGDPRSLNAAFAAF